MRVGTPVPSTPEAPTSGLETLRLSPCRSRVLSQSPYSFSFCFTPLFPYFLVLLLFLSSDGNTTRADAGRYRSLHGKTSSVQTCGYTRTRTHAKRDRHARMHAHTHAQIHTRRYASTKETSCRTYRRPPHCWLISELRGRKAGKKKEMRTGKRDTVGLRNRPGKSERQLTLERSPRERQFVAADDSDHLQ